jgi:peptide deformylase
VAIRDITLLGDPVLRRRAEPVTEVDESVRELAQDMMDTMVEAPGIGLAAPQVGVSLRMITLNLEEASGAIINPVVARSSRDEESDLEACLSIPDVQGLVRRPSSVVVKGLDMDGRKVVLKAEGLLARCLQHEIDHLDGAVFLDRVTDPKVKVFHRVEDPDADEETYESELVTIAEVHRRFEELHAAKTAAPGA